jgi:hypothetical protein
MTRQLDDRIEVYEKEVQGKCVCGVSVTKVINSSIATFQKDKLRYYYTGDTSAWGIFRCKICRRPIDASFKLFQQYSERETEIRK